MPLFDLVGLVLEAYLQYLRRLDLLAVAGVALLLVYAQYRRNAALEARLFGSVRYGPLRRLGRAAAAGLAGGLLATGLFVALGIPLNDVGVWLLWLVALALMLIHPRFLCFAYGAGLLSLAHLAFGLPGFDVAAAMALVAVLHLVEAVLIYWTGADGAMPVYAADGRGGVVGGFTMQRFWPLPFVALLGAFVPPEIAQSAGGVHMPDWWPIFEPEWAGRGAGEYVFALFPVVAALGYGDLALASPPGVKAKRTARSLLGYSLGLLALAVLARVHAAFAFAAALYSPLAHEWVIFRARRAERDGPFCFSGADTMVLDVHPGSPAARAGVRSGDVILAVGGFPVRTREDVYGAMQLSAGSTSGTVVEVENAFDKQRRRLVCRGRPPWGIMLVPRAGDLPHMQLETKSRWRQVFAHISEKFSPRR